MSATAPRRLVLFDGDCGLCDSAVQWLLRHDKDDALLYSPLQGETAAALRARHPVIPTAIDTMVMVEGEAPDEKVTLRSAAVLAICAALPAPWRWARHLRIIPRAIADFAYRIIAKNRIRFFGRKDTCRIPTERERARLLP